MWEGYDLEARIDQAGGHCGQQLRDVSSYVYQAILSKRVRESSGEAARAEAAPVMAALPPGIGKIEMISSDGARRDQVLDDAASIAAEHPDVCQCGRIDGSTGTGHQAPSALKSKEVTVGVVRGSISEEFSRAASDLYIYRPVITEHGMPRDGLQNKNGPISWGARVRLR